MTIYPNFNCQLNPIEAIRKVFPSVLQYYNIVMFDDSPTLGPIKVKKAPNLESPKYNLIG